MFLLFFTRQKVSTRKIGLASEVLRSQVLPVGLDLTKANKSTYWIKGLLNCEYEIQKGLFIIYLFISNLFIVDKFR